MIKKSIYTRKLGTSVAFSARPARAKKYHVITSNSQKWAVVADGNIRPTKVFSTRLSAINFAKIIANKIKGEVIIHNYTGEIEERVSLAK